MNIIITSEHRVGSRWLHYLLADILDKGISPERDGQPVGVIKSSIEVKSFLNHNRIAKYHHGTRETINRGLLDVYYKLIGMVRNPRDRGVSKAFHDFYHPKHNYSVKNQATNDFQAVKWTVGSEPYIDDNWRQLELMEDGHSTRDYRGDSRYIWTSYEWMKDDAEREITSILQHFGVILPTGYNIKDFVSRHSFKNKSGREPGQEDRKNNWRRKGMMLDWITWFDNDMRRDTQAIQEEYWKQLISNGGR